VTNRFLQIGNSRLRWEFPMCFLLWIKNNAVSVRRILRDVSHSSFRICWGCTILRVELTRAIPGARPSGALTRCILHLALRATSLRSVVQIGSPADLSCVQICSCKFVNHLRCLVPPHDQTKRDPAGVPFLFGGDGYYRSRLVSD